MSKRKRPSTVAQAEQDINRAIYNATIALSEFVDAYHRVFPDPESKLHTDAIIGDEGLLAAVKALKTMLNACGNEPTDRGILSIALTHVATQAGYRLHEVPE